MPLQRFSRFVFEPISNENIGILFYWRNSAFFLKNCTNRKKLKSINLFTDELKLDFQRDRHRQFVIIASSKQIGTVYSYSYNKTDQYCFISVFTDELFIGKGYSLTATVIFCRQLFKELNLYKIYLDIYEYNVKLIKLLKKRNIAVEGEFRKQHVHQGKRYDVIRFAIYNENINSWLNKYEI